MRKTVIIVDSDSTSRDDLDRLLEFCGNVSLIAKTGNANRAIELVTVKKPDIIFIDIEMPIMSGFEIVEITRNMGLNPVVIFTTSKTQYAIKAIKFQAFDYLIKPVMLDELKETLIRFSNSVFNIQHLNLTLGNLLSQREVEVFDMVIHGNTSRDIAEKLFISKTTVDTHRRNILVKTGAKNTSELLVKAMA